ncbi:MAG: c-type cytochrome [Myxococcales bacterium]|jgi:cytochrome c oxidase cbb3-type subunit 3|nr:c-type cytochrome [Myxococcales bacterium]MBK7193728.1 c-type cytochrome [Myxococcales bacterium]MBL8626729.1 c-type cytochrome [Myxococcales bacterium]MBP6844798.1 c-type cytochrome [Kofleriaceae bacterium]
MSDGSKPRPDGQILDHCYDGIQEYDNPLPGWWSAFFIITIVFSGFYLFWYHLGGPGKSVTEVYAADYQAYEKQRVEREAADLSSVSEASIASAAGNADMLATGKTIFTSTCATCHQPDGSGLIGPNLTDGNQLHGTTRMDIYATVRNGVPNTAMVPWGAQLKPAEVIAVSAYVVTLRNKPLPGKAAEGAPVGPFAAP